MWFHFDKVFFCSVRRVIFTIEIKMRPACICSSSSSRKLKRCIHLNFRILLLLLGCIRANWVNYFRLYDSTQFDVVIYLYDVRWILICESHRKKPDVRLERQRHLLEAITWTKPDSDDARAHSFRSIFLLFSVFSVYVRCSPLPLASLIFLMLLNVIAFKLVLVFADAHFSSCMCEKWAVIKKECSHS